MRTFTRRPDWTVTIQRPDYTKSTLTYKTVRNWAPPGKSTNVVRFVSSKNKANKINNYTDCIEYSYDNRISDPAGAFTLNFVPRLDSRGFSWKDKILEKDIVLIFEFGKLRYIGVVKNTGYSMSMSVTGPNRSISISGVSIGGQLQTFDLPMNVYLWYNLGTTADTQNNTLVAALNSKVDAGQTLNTIFTSIKDAFFSVVFAESARGFQTVMNELFDLQTDSLDVFYPMNLRPFQQSTNTLWQIFRQILPMPVYEIFGKLIDERYTLICRQAPFDLREWYGTKITRINPLYLIDHTIGDSDDEVFTHFFSQMPNSAFSQNEIYADNALNEVSIFDQEKLEIFGYRQLSANFPFFDLAKGKDFNAKQFLKQNSARLYAWFKNNIEFQSGTITLHTVPDKKNEYIDIGERIEYLVGNGKSAQFYVEGVKRTMSYPETMKSVYTVTRGYEYGFTSTTIDGITVPTPQVQKISNIGSRLRQAEKDLMGINT